MKHAAVVETFALVASRARGARTAGVDGVTGKAAEKNFTAFVTSVEQALETGVLMPLAEREIAKPDGGVRRLTFPTLTERAIAAAIGWVLNFFFDASFDDRVVGCRPGRGPHDALRLAMEFIPGAVWLAKIDFKSFFDNVLHRPLVAALERRIDDKRFIGLIERLIQRPTQTAGARLRGVPQGCPASPLLANLSAQPFDQWLAGMGVAFIRYVDDIVIFWPGNRAGLELLIESVSNFLPTLGLELAQQKTIITSADAGVPFLGHLLQLTNGVGEVHPHQDRVARFQARMHERADALALATSQKEINAIKNSLFNHLRAFSDFYLPHRESLEIGAEAFYEAVRKYPRLGPANPSGFTVGRGMP